MADEFQYALDHNSHRVRIEARDGRFLVQVGDRNFQIAARAGDAGRLDLEVDGRRLRAYYVHEGNFFHVAVDGETWRLAKPEPARRLRGPTGDESGRLTAPMPGRVLEVIVAQGDFVNKGDTLLLLEAMKMELRIQAPLAGRVIRTPVVAGQVIERGQVLVEVSSPGATEDL